METEITAEDNVNRVLRHYGLDRSITITRVGPNWVEGWPVKSGTGEVDHSIVVFIFLHDWPQDPNVASLHFHGTKSCVREPGGVHPALQISAYLRPDGPGGYSLHIDLDESAPRAVKGRLWHLWEVIRGAVTKQPTDQDKIARMLDKRFGPEENES